MKNKKIKGSIVGAFALAATLVVGMSPMTAYAQASEEPECICEEKCTKDHVNTKCEICVADYSLCKGTEKAAEEEFFGPLTPDGNLTLVDDYGSVQAGGKQFITVVTKTGNYFYIIIDRDDEGEETVHFLNMVDESDLLKLMDDEEAQAYISSITGDSQKEPSTEEKETTEEPASEEEEPVKEEKQASNKGVLFLLLGAVGAGIGGYFYLNQSKGKKETASDWDPDYDYNEDEDYLAHLPEAEELEDKNYEEINFEEE